MFPTSTRNRTSLPATSAVTYSTSHVTMTVFSEPLGGPRSCQSTTAMTSMGEFPYFLQSWGQSPPPATHLLTNWAWQLGWRLGHVFTALLALVFRVPTVKTCFLSWWESSGGTSGVTRRGVRSCHDSCRKPGLLSFLKSCCLFLPSSACSLLLKTWKAGSVRRLTGVWGLWQVSEASDRCQGLTNEVGCK